ncbi:MAG: hypothetical protein Q9216_000821 [Gyalolechia sp. 2 TL-2023]
MAEASIASPGSTADSGRKPAVKNTKCKYCGTPFTTSSLGRHLDLYIREKNPKPADGLHNVDEIRQMRNNVTRRQAKSSTKRESSTPTNSKGTPSRDQPSPSTALHLNGNPETNGAQVKPQWNRAMWQATGVINDLPSVSRGSQSRSLSRTEGTRSSKVDIALKEVAVEERDRALAVELALKEVLGSLRTANARAHPQSPFDFDFFRLSFPGLCLRCMPPPRSMSSHHSNLGQETWRVEHPGPAEYEYMKRYVFAKLQEWKARVTQDEQQSGSSGDIGQNLMNDLAKEEIVHQQHFEQAYNNWQTLAQEKKEAEWRLECQKAYAEEYDRHQDTRERLDQLEQEIHHLQERLNQENNGQISSSSNFEVSSIPLSRTTINSFSPQQARDLQLWDYDRLLDKWKQRIRQQRSVQHPLPTLGPWSSNSTPMDVASSAYEHRPLDGSHPHHDEGDELEDEDLADAPGEDEDEDPTSAAVPNGMLTRDVLDPTLRPGSENADVGGRMLMGLKGFHGVNGNGNGNGNGYDINLKSPRGGTNTYHSFLSAVVLFHVHYPPSTEERDAVLDSVDDVADDGEDEEEEDYNDGDDEVAADHCRRGGFCNGEGRWWWRRSRGGYQA